ncbi:carbohydrate ABC transporter permease [Enterococcus phoeniculicola]|jgi:putative aldouronate transport system permease protein|uniref:ABC transporter permease n=1 Tax=Enterococcus phoeniculicola ATCC BAA-412 TaxID=1158610 RepID=R3WEI8_9ENTE|nr:carbohydrate ABC transporter permease [Enterococcus phoeniculicola]EOL46291.1 ABC transporter permease [Enterococcus phoeniculicola ATCC BAA-412]EOT76864.1 ABC transporter permease [Enterococcus phoeniculicola ATCC BAA-412]
MEKQQVQSVNVKGFSPKANILFSVLMWIVAISCIFPFLFVIIISFTSEQSLTTQGYQIIPSQWSLDGYRYLFEMKDQILQALFITVFVTIVGTIVNVAFTSTYAYALSRDSLPFKKFFTVFVLISMLFSAGMVPNYIVMTSLLGLKDNILALILPMALSSFNIIVMRTFYRRSVPDSIIEAAKIDGAGDLRTFIQIVLPLSIPGLATISLFAALGYWNDWFNALLYIQSDNLVPLQYLLMKIQANIDFIIKNAATSAQLGSVTIPKEATRMAMVVLSTAPIAATYPFFQKYFVGGLTIGGVKE